MIVVWTITFLLYFPILRIYIIKGFGGTTENDPLWLLILTLISFMLALIFSVNSLMITLGDIWTLIS